MSSKWSLSFIFFPPNSNLKQNFTQTRCSSRSFVYQLAKKSPRVLNTHSFKRVKLDDYLTWRDAASVRIKLTVPATRRHNRERAARARCLAISKVRFLYGLPTYVLFLFFLSPMRTTFVFAFPPPSLFP